MLTRRSKISLEDKLALLSGLIAMTIATAFGVKARYAYPTGPIAAENFTHLNANNFLNNLIGNVSRAGIHNADCILGAGSLAFFAADQVFTLRELLLTYNLPLTWIKLEAYRFPQNAPYEQQYWANNHGGIFVPGQTPINLTESITAIKEWIVLPENHNFTILLQLQFSEYYNETLQILGPLVFTPKLGARYGFANDSQPQPTVQQLLNTGAQIIIPSDFPNWFPDNDFEERLMFTRFTNMYFPPLISTTTTDTAFLQGYRYCMDFLGPTDPRLYDPTTRYNMVPELTTCTGLLYPANPTSYGVIMTYGVGLNSWCALFAVANILCTYLKVANNTTALLISDLTSTMALAYAIFGFGLMAPANSEYLYYVSAICSMLGAIATVLHALYVKSYLEDQNISTTQQPLKSIFGVATALELAFMLNVLTQTSAVNKYTMPTSGWLAVYCIFALSVCNILLRYVNSNQDNIHSMIKSNVKYSTLLGIGVASIGVCDPDNAFNYTMGSAAVTGFGCVIAPLFAIMRRQDLKNQVGDIYNSLPSYNAMRRSNPPRSSDTANPNFVAPKLSVV